MRLWAAIAVVLCAVASGCQSDRAREAQREAEQRRVQNDKDSPAFKAGQAAHEIARKTGEAAAAAARKLDESARKAREGWKEQGQKDRARDSAARQ